MNVIAIIYEFHHQVLLSSLPSRTIGCHSLNGVGSGRCPLSCYTTCVTIHITNSMMHDVFLLSLEICENWLELNPDKKNLGGGILLRDGFLHLHLRRKHLDQGLQCLLPSTLCGTWQVVICANLGWRKNWSQLENPELAINNLEPL